MYIVDVHQYGIFFSKDFRPFCFWWSGCRIDYQLEVPAGLENSEYLPNTAYAHIVQARYWEAKEMFSFILRQVIAENLMYFI